MPLSSQAWSYISSSCHHRAITSLLFLHSHARPLGAMSQNPPRFPSDSASPVVRQAYAQSRDQFTATLPPPINTIDNTLMNQIHNVRVSSIESADIAGDCGSPGQQGRVGHRRGSCARRRNSARERSRHTSRSRHSRQTRSCTGKNPSWTSMTEIRSCSSSTTMHSRRPCRQQESC